jgi:hypothetical protein
MWDAVVEHDLEVPVLEAAESGGIAAVRARLAPYGVAVLFPPGSDVGEYERSP